MSTTATHNTGEAHDDDHAFARACAEEAGARLLEIRAAAAPDTDPRELKAAGDRGAQSLLADLLKRHRPYDATLSEEAADDHGRLRARRVWIIDPLDGTREFAEPPREDWAVHVALWEEGELRAGAVALPARGTVLCTDDPVPPRAPVRRRPRMLVSRTRAPEFVTRLAEELGADVVPQGSAGAKTASVVLGEADLYVHMRRPVRMGLGGTRGGRRPLRLHRSQARRQRAALQPGGSDAARPGRLRTGAARAVPGGVRPGLPRLAGRRGGRGRMTAVVQQGCTVWLTGLPSSGKTTIATALAERLRGDGHRVEVLDGDVIRSFLSVSLGFSREDRDTNVQRIGLVAEILARNRITALVPVIAPYRNSREAVRKRHEQSGTPTWRSMSPRPWRCARSAM